MFSFRMRTVAVIFTLSVAQWAVAQQPNPPAQAQPTPQSRAAGASEYVDFSGFKGKVFDVKHRDPRALVEALRPLESGFKGATIYPSDEFRTITVRDFPENIAAIEEALKRLDVPQPPQPDVELRVNVLIASNAEGVANQYPRDLGDVVKQLQATLSYKNYLNVATLVQRVKAGSRGIGMQGVAEVAESTQGKDGELNRAYSFRAQQLTLIAEPSGGTTAQLSNVQFDLYRQGPNAEIRTDISLRNGEKVVVGTTTLGNRGLILVLSATVQK